MLEFILALQQHSRFETKKTFQELLAPRALPRLNSPAPHSFTLEGRLPRFQHLLHIYVNTHTHTHTCVCVCVCVCQHLHHIYVNMCVCVCVCVCVWCVCVTEPDSRRMIPLGCSPANLAIGSVFSIHPAARLKALARKESFLSFRSACSSASAETNSETSVLGHSRPVC